MQRSLRLEINPQYLSYWRLCQKDGKMLFTGLTNDEMAKIIPLCCSDSQHLQSCQR